MVGIDAIKMSKPHMNEDVFGVAKINFEIESEFRRMHISGMLSL